MHTSEINIRDPYVLVHNGAYYLYGTRSETCWGAGGRLRLLHQPGYGKLARSCRNFKTAGRILRGKRLTPDDWTCIDGTLYCLYNGVKTLALRRNL